MLYNGLTWLRTVTCVLLCTVRVFMFHKIRGILWLAEELLSSQEGLCSKQLVNE